MNGRQAARAAAKLIEELEFYKREATLDIRAYNGCILSMIKGGSPCEWCNDQVECQKPEKAAQKGCDEWILSFRDYSGTQETEEAPDIVAGVGGDDVEGP